MLHGDRACGHFQSFAPNARIPWLCPVELATAQYCSQTRWAVRGALPEGMRRKYSSHSSKKSVSCPGDGTKDTWAPDGAPPLSVRSRNQTTIAMSYYSFIQWCHCTVNPCMGCDGCELFPCITRLIRTINEWLVSHEVSNPYVRKVIELEVESRTPSATYHSRVAIAKCVLAAALPGMPVSPRQVRDLACAIAAEFRCYAAILHLRYAKNSTKPHKVGKKGFAPTFEEVTLFRGRAAAAANWSDLKNVNDPEKPWLDGARRLIFLSDMGDLLSRAVTIEYILEEVIGSVSSSEGQRHFWLWLTKRPARMAQFSRWLHAQGIAWPDNLVAMTSVTSGDTVGRVAALKKVKCRYRGLSIEPLWSAVKLPLDQIDWAIVGGESGPWAKPFELDWARDIRTQCAASGTAFFLKQIGTKPTAGGIPIRLQDRHGGDWAEWPADLRVRDLPQAFRR